MNGTLRNTVAAQLAGPFPSSCGALGGDERPNGKTKGKTDGTSAGS